MNRVLLSVCFLALTIPAFAQKDVQKKLQTKFIEAENGSVIELEEGTFHLDASLSIDGKKNLTIKGKGMNKTILSFKGQISGAEGIKVTDGSNIVLQDLTVQDSKGDCIKTQKVDGIVFRNVKVEWTGGPNKDNGGYGLYPVQCKNVLIEGCEAIAASDAGIYVGQSQNVIVRNSKAHENVAGIEIENTLYADVYENEAVNNVGGVLVFDLPGLMQKKGGFVRVFNNNIHDNNHVNFAPKGNIVAKVPQGTGVMILATNNVEIFDNKIINNRTVGTAITSYYISEIPIKDKEYYPYPTNIYIHDNVFERKHERATMKGRMGKMYRFKLKFGKDVPFIQYDGIVDAKFKNEDGSLKPELGICFLNNKNQSFANLDAENGFKNISRDIKPFEREGIKQKEVVLSIQ
ncbi:right-handed parallel beta-helix repeat-containing protein [Solitalea sp. MAHUQ-68]|uniref:Right-handed parallel beta-helix repeat-containing protein n=1 Tax=Solitalea agri TaxID=2953739 RepID=A0A9X2EYW9_9SPHI|nr:parallel beta-helix domain-containing protein [Solitalea agri]MCO4291492.1 right-handed parallel beta-helix repeat-containing protein [Solitalea agri]